MSFDYVRPSSLAEASRLLAGAEAVALAGGTDLMVAIRHRAVHPELVVDLKHVSDIPDEITIEEGRLRIGGLATMATVTGDERVLSTFAALADAGAVVGSVQIRNRATLAGNICNASPAADTAPALLAYRATVEVGSGDGSRLVPLSSFFTGPGRTVLEKGDLVKAVLLPLPEGRRGAAFARVTRRRGVDLATINLACVVDDAGTVDFGLGAVGPTPLYVSSSLSELDSEAGWSRVMSVATPISDVRAASDYRSAMLRIHAERALARAREQLRKGLT